MVNKNEKGATLLIMLIIGVLIVAGLYVYSLSKTDEANKQITPTGSSSTDTPAEKARGAVDATQGAQDRLNKAGSIIENGNQ